jgi:hypothetical protein
MPEIVYVQYDINTPESYLSIIPFIISFTFFIICVVSSIARLYSVNKYGSTGYVLSTLNGISIFISLIAGFIGLFFNTGLYLQLKKHNDSIPDNTNEPVIYNIYNNINKYKIFAFILVAIISLQILYLIFNNIFCIKC